MIKTENFILSGEENKTGYPVLIGDMIKVIKEKDFIKYVSTNKSKAIIPTVKLK